MVVLDASFLIAYFAGSDSHHPRAKRLMVSLRGISLAAATITLAEAFVHPVRAGREDRVRDLLERAGIRAIGVSPGDEISLARLRAETGLKMPDCCVIAAAERHGGRIATFDDGLAEVAAKRGIEVLERD